MEIKTADSECQGSTIFSPPGPLFPFLLPPRHQLMRHAKAIQHPRDHGIHDLRDAPRAGAEEIGGENRRAGLSRSSKFRT